jgi:signal transduction histidine kinase
MSHELRTPLNIVMGYTELLQEGNFGLLTDEQGKVLQKIDKSAKELSGLISSILDVHRLETRHTSVEIDEVNIASLMEELCQEREQECDNPDVTFVWRVGEKLPVFYNDRTKLKVILKHLLANAVKFTPSGNVTLGVVPHEGGIEFSVHDTGIGIAPDAIPVIFEMFRQGDGSTKRSYNGSGLGLYIVRRLLDLLGGVVSVESKVGVGSTFHVWVPNLRPKAASQSHLNGSLPPS